MNERQNEDWKPTFWEVANSRSWTENLYMYFATFGAVFYFAFNPQTILEWVFAVIIVTILTFGYWALMINFNREAIHKDYQKFQQQRRELASLDKQLEELENAEQNMSSNPSKNDLPDDTPTDNTQPMNTIMVNTMQEFEPLKGDNPLPSHQKLNK